MTTPRLELRNLSKRFGNVIVADGLDLTVSPNQALGIVGPNGAGKSSLFSMISGDLDPDKGTVLLDGADVTRKRADVRAAHGVGRTFQIPRPFEGLTVFENVLVFATAAAGLRKDAANRLAASSLERCGLGDLANRPAGALGLLDRKRLEVARALGSDPQLLLLDEVGGGLTDPEVALLVDLVNKLKADGLTIVWIEHVVHALLASVERLVCLAGGRLVADGDPHDVLNDANVRDLYLGHAVVLEQDLR